MATKGAKAKNKNAVRKPITYFYNPYFKNETELQFLEVWQVLEDDVLGSLYPWQYTPTAELSNRIVSLNFLALKNFEKDYRSYFDQIFIYKASAKLLAEGNVHRLGSIIQPNLILCFDVYQLEKYGDKAALAGLKFLVSIGATIMLEGVDKAPVDVLMKYPASYFLLDYRYYNKDNKGLIYMMSQITDANNITMIVNNVKDKNNLDIFTSNGINIFSGSAFARPKRKIESFIKASGEEGEKEKKKFVVQAEDAPVIVDKIKEDKEEVTLEVSTQQDELRARLAASAEAKKKAKEEEIARKKAEEEEARRLEELRQLEEKKAAIEEAKRRAKNLKAGQVGTSNEEFAELSKKDKEEKDIVRGANVIKLSVARPTKGKTKK